MVAARNLPKLTILVCWSSGERYPNPSHSSHMLRRQCILGQSCQSPPKSPASVTLKRFPLGSYPNEVTPCSGSVTRVGWFNASYSMRAVRPIEFVRLSIRPAPSTKWLKLWPRGLVMSPNGPLSMRAREFHGINVPRNPGMGDDDWRLLICPVTSPRSSERAKSYFSVDFIL